MRQFATPYKAAERGYVDQVIEPAETRPRVINAFNMLATKRESRRPRSTATFRCNPKTRGGSNMSITLITVPDTMEGAIILSIVDFFLSIVIIYGISLVLHIFPYLNKLGNVTDENLKAGR